MPGKSAKRTSYRKPRKSAASKRRTSRKSAKRTSSRKPRKSAAPKRRTSVKRTTSRQSRKSAAPKRRTSAKTFVMSVQLQADDKVIANTEGLAAVIIQW